LDLGSAWASEAALGFGRRESSCVFPRPRNKAQSARNHGSLRVPWEYLMLLSGIRRRYGRGLRRGERRRLEAAGGAAVGNLAGEAARLLVRRATSGGKAARA